MTDRRECYIPLTPDPERTAHAVAIWQEVAERLGLPGPTDPPTED